MGKFDEILRNSEDPALKSFRENFPDVAGPIATLFDEFVNRNAGMIESRVSAVEEDLLAQKIPNLKAVRQHPEWSAWLRVVDRYGQMRQVAFDVAMSTLNVGAISNLVQDFKAEKGLSSTRPGGTPGNPGADHPIARSFIRQFSIDVARGKYRGKEAEAKAIQDKIDAAVAAGKVLNQ